MKELIVNLDAPPEERWLFLSVYKNEINELLQCYLNDFKGASILLEGISSFKTLFLSETYLKEIEGIASFTNFTTDEIIVANLYYDILKFYFGCTAFAVYTNKQMLHARNMDWHTENNMLSTYSKVFDFRKNGKTIFKSIGWPGFIGVLSGTKPEQFTVTLNAVLSNDDPEVTKPISFLLRDVLEQCNTYEEAKEILETTTIASDCLLLLSGTKETEKVVIERTPKRYATRTSDNNYIVVTNDYKELQNCIQTNSVLQETSCGRYDSAKKLLAAKNILNSNDCFDILQDKNVMMNITVQQMVFNTTSGAIDLICTE